ncbi:tRNA nucleotidyltransferase [Rhizodiscina lignyota]|uniref:tRNA nucleotidyltransferase n=1 Tax=Rhizodiscina lignyota TaxID=1504668 RepID=A0A9P4MFD2_9PEZI|nr:tRNA nucleotidyltransferase [Rhizodiscina lignyota]
MAMRHRYRSKIIELNDVEQTLRHLLLDTAEYIEDSPSVPESEAQPPSELQNENLVLRFTGGWVRDKLLDTQSHDIDVAINKMTGYQFGLKMKEYLEIPGNAEKYGLASTESSSKSDGKRKMGGGLYKIEANPEKSKHLETVTTKILGLDIDLVNLRKETYTEDSRNPQMEFGTPEEDAVRRDATVNAMFYNINTSQIEDFTERGFDDMEAKIIRTPLEPYQTFKDDPLRVLRLIRFATRLDFEIDSAAQGAMNNDDIREALRIKISRERVGIELEKMLKGRDPAGALTYINKLNLYNTVFTDPTNKPDYVPETKNWKAVYMALEMLISPKNISSDRHLRPILLSSFEGQYQAWISAALIPWVDAPLPAPPKKNRTPVPLAVAVAREGFKAPNKVANIVESSLHNYEEIRELKDKFISQSKFPHKRKEGDDATARDTLGMAIRRWGASWREQAVFSLLYEIFQNPDSTESIELSYTNFLKHLEALELLNAYAIKPLMDGKALSTALSTPPGPWMKDALDVVVAWQLRHPDATDPSEAIEAVKLHLENNQASASAQKRRSIDKGGKDAPSSKSKTEDSAKSDLLSSLITHFLRRAIRPLFSQASHPSVTPSARKRDIPLPQNPTLPSEAATQTPWKHDPYVLHILRWILNSLTPTTVETNWPLLIPPILAMIDDHETRFKARGCDFLTLLLSATPPALLARTGLAGVFEEALTPALSYLPTLTPVEQSVTILNSAYPALVTLTRTRFPGEARNDAPEIWDAKVKAIDKLIRHGVLHGMSFAGEHPAVAEVLITQLGVLVREEGIDSVKHLKETVPLLGNVLADPFALAHVELMRAAVGALGDVVRMGWPRIEGWKGEVLKGLCLGWGKVLDEGTEGNEGVKKLMEDMEKCVEMLDEALKMDGKGGLKEDAEILITADGRLEGLFEHINQ